MPSSGRTSKPRVETLRSSCDSCYVSKIKCSKSRPLCSRCLVCGTNCTYSPSGRSGRRKKTEDINIVPNDDYPEQIGDEASSYHTNEALHTVPKHNMSSQNTSAPANYSSPATYVPRSSQPEYIDPLLLMNTEVTYQSWAADPSDASALAWWPTTSTSTTTSTSYNGSIHSPSTSTTLTDQDIVWEHSYSSAAPVYHQPNGHQPNTQNAWSDAWL